MKTFLSTLVTLLLCLAAIGQHAEIDLNTGIGIYSLKNLKNFQKNAKDDLNPLNVHMVADFPAYPNYTLSQLWYFSKSFQAGINLGFFTTGARNSAKDYSGEYTLDMILDGYRAGLQIGFLSYSLNSFSFTTNFLMGANFTIFKLKEDIEIVGMNHIHSANKFYSTTFFCLPGVSVGYPLNNHYSINLSIGYQLETNGKLKNENRYMSYHNQDVLVNWSGFRTSCGLAIRF